LLNFIISERFCKYDYGTNGNMQYYNMKSPPDYNLSKVTTPVYILHSKNDHLSAVKVFVHFICLKHNAICLYNKTFYLEVT